MVVIIEREYKHDRRTRGRRLRTRARVSLGGPRIEEDAAVDLDHCRCYSRETGGSAVLFPAF